MAAAPPPDLTDATRRTLNQAYGEGYNGRVYDAAKYAAPEVGVGPAIQAAHARGARDKAAGRPLTLPYPALAARIVPIAPEGARRRRKTKKAKRRHTKRKTYSRRR